MLAWALAEWLGIVGFALGVLNGAAGIWVWHRRHRTKVVVSIRHRPREVSGSTIRFDVVFIEAVNHSEHTIYVDGVRLIWSDRNVEVPRELLKDDPEVPPHAKYVAALDTAHVRATNLAFPADVVAIIKLTTTNKEFRSPKTRLE